MYTRWIDCIKHQEWFLPIGDENCILSNHHFPYDDSSGDAGIATNIKHVWPIVWNHPGLPEPFRDDPPSYLYVTDPIVNQQPDGQLGAPKKAPALSAGYLALIWGRDEVDPVYRGNGDVGEAGGVRLFRDTNPEHPAMIEYINPRLHYCDGVLHRSGGHAAFRADHIIAHWRLGSKVRRVGGPCRITLSGYQEKWTHGKFESAGWKSERYYWAPGSHEVGRVDCDLTGKTSRMIKQNDTHLMGMVRDEFNGPFDPTGIQFFLDPQDAMIYANEVMGLATPGVRFDGSSAYIPGGGSLKSTGTFSFAMSFSKRTGITTTVQI